MIFINAHFRALIQNHGGIKDWRIKLWRISYQLPNSPKFSPTNVLCYTVYRDGIIQIGMYGTHQLQLKRDTRVPRMCRPRNAHTVLLHVCNFVFLSLTPRTREKTHELRVHVYTFFYIRARVSWYNVHTATSL